MAYREIDGNGELRFEHVLARDLGMTVARMRAEMPNAEFVRWRNLYAIEAQEREVASR